MLLQKKIISIIALIAMCVSANLFSQDFTDIKNKKPFSIKGSVGAELSTSLYSPKTYSRPLGYLLNLNLCPSIYGIDIPLSASFGNNGFAYSHPFSIVQISPSYKWIRAYIGRTSMSMSQYGLSGIIFDGMGLELSPPKIPFSFAAMFGRINKAQKGDSLTNASYARWGYGLKVGFSKSFYRGDIHFFNAIDNIKSLKEVAYVAQLPVINFVLTHSSNFSFLKHWQAFADVGLSWYGNRFDPRNSFSHNGEVQSSLNRKTEKIPLSFSYSAKIGLSAYGFSLSYERLDPNYKNLGVAYVNADLENVVLGYSGTLFKKLSLSANIGYQRDNLNKYKNTSMQRIVGSARLSTSIGGNINLSLMYSNFTMYTRGEELNIAPEEAFRIINPDSLKNIQISQSASADIMYSFLGKKEDLGQSLAFSLSFQESGVYETKTMSKYLFSSLSHSISIASLDMGINTGVHYNLQWIDLKNDAYSYLGPNIMLSKRFLQDKSLSTSYGLQYDVGLRQKAESGIFSLNTSVAYVLKQKHNFEYRMSLRQNHYFAQENKGQWYFSASIRYSYRF